LEKNTKHSKLVGVQHEGLIHVLQGCKQGQRDSQQALYNRFYKLSMRICVRYVRNEEDALEAMQDGFIKVFRQIKNFEPPRDPDMTCASLYGWIRKIMVYTSINQFRKSQRQISWEGEEKLMHYETATNENPLDKMAYEDLIKMIQQLTPAYRSVFNLFVIDGFSHEEIAGLLNISVSTSKSNLLRAREKLRQMIKNDT
jgi:RNA polymerase sigma-70 factor (ECF subfamily)